MDLQGFQLEYEEGFCRSSFTVENDSEGYKIVPTEYPVFERVRVYSIPRNNNIALITRDVLDIVKETENLCEGDESDIIKYMKKATVDGKIGIHVQKEMFGGKKPDLFLYSEWENGDRIVTMNLGKPYSGGLIVPEPMETNANLSRVFHSRAVMEGMKAYHKKMISNCDLLEGPILCKEALYFYEQMLIYSDQVWKCVNFQDTELDLNEEKEPPTPEPTDEWTEEGRQARIEGRRRSKHIDDD